MTAPAPAPSPEAVRLAQDFAAAVQMASIVATDASVTKLDNEKAREKIAVARTALLTHIAALEAGVDLFLAVFEHMLTDRPVEHDFMVCHKFNGAAITYADIRRARALRQGDA